MFHNTTTKRTSKRGFWPAVMYHFPFHNLVSNFGTNVSVDGSGYKPSSFCCGTQLISETAHLLNSPTTSFSNKSPHLIWHPISSSLPLQVLIHATFAKHFGFVIHFKNGTWHLVIKQPTIAFESDAIAGKGDAPNAPTDNPNAKAETATVCFIDRRNLFSLFAPLVLILLILMSLSLSLLFLLSAYLHVWDSWQRWLVRVVEEIMANVVVDVVRWSVTKAEDVDVVRIKYPASARNTILFMLFIEIVIVIVLKSKVSFISLQIWCNSIYVLVLVLVLVSFRQRNDALLQTAERHLMMAWCVWCVDVQRQFVHTVLLELLP